jgi:diaminopimelate decarboxylase
MSRLEFDEVWRFIKDYVLPAEVGDSVLVPDAGEYDLVKRNFVSKSSERKG